jgi:type VI secretion system protein ImpC
METHSAAICAWLEEGPALGALVLPSDVTFAIRLGLAEATAGGGLDGVLDRVIATLDAALSAAVDSILHHPEFQQLEAAWRGLDDVTRGVDFHENIKIAIWHISKESLANDFQVATEIVRSQAFATIYTAEFGQFGGEPYGAVLANMEFDASAPDVALLRNLASVAAMAQAPFFAAASSSLLRLQSWRDLPSMADLTSVAEESFFSAWRALRELPDSRYVGLLLPRVLMRAPYSASTDQPTPFHYVERVGQAGAGLLWGSPIHAFARRLAASFAQYRTLGAIVGDEERSPPAPETTTFPSLGRRHVKPPVEVDVTPRIEHALRDLGLIALQHRRGSTQMFVSSANSLQLPKSYGGATGPEATLSHLLGTKFPYLFLACRIAHYVKVIERDAIGSVRSAEEIEASLNEWLSRLVVDMDSVTPAVRAQYPLRKAAIAVRPSPGSPGWYDAEIAIRPHLRYLGSGFTLTLKSPLERHGSG